MKHVGKHHAAPSIARGALDRLLQDEDRTAIRSAEMEMLAQVKQERDPIGPRGEVDLHLASPMFKLGAAPRVPSQVSEDLRQDAIDALHAELRHEREMQKIGGQKRRKNRTTESETRESNGDREHKG